MPAQLMLPQQQLLMEKARPPPLMERQLLQEMELKLLQKQLEMLRQQVEMKLRLNFSSWQNTTKFYIIFRKIF
jgi:hypothetical protein